MMKKLTIAAGLVCVGMIVGDSAAAQAPASAGTAARSAAAPVVALPPGYVIGPEDVLSIVFWRDKELSADVVVRPDGKITLPLLNDVPAAGYTPEQLAGVVEKAATRYIADPDATVSVKDIRSRKIFVLGEVNKQGPILLNTEMTVVQVLAEAGGPLEYADKENITIVRQENGKERRIKFNFADYLKGRNAPQNIVMKPGDTVLVP